MLDSPGMQMHKRPARNQCHAILVIVTRSQRLAVQMFRGFCFDSACDCKDTNMPVIIAETWLC